VKLASKAEVEVILSFVDFLKAIEKTGR